MRRSQSNHPWLHCKKFFAFVRECAVQETAFLGRTFKTWIFNLLEVLRHGKGKIRTHQAARERRHDRPRGSRPDDADGGADEGRCGAVWRRVQGVRPD